MNNKKTFKPCDLVIFGALGDLSTRKLLLCLYQLDKANLLESDTKIIGVDRFADEGNLLLKAANTCLDKFLKEARDQTVWERFSARMSYLQMDLTKPAEYAQLSAVVDKDKRRMINYFSVPPFLFKSICQGLKLSGALTPESRMVMEKPIGYDLASSEEINNAVSDVFTGDQVCRIDHYLGKETVLNLLALRFANSIFTTNWDHNTIDHIQITVAEEVGIEGRWGYFDESGQTRDMMQNHLLQILTFIAMEPPVSLDASNIHYEKIKVLKDLRPITKENVAEKTVRGQYAAGEINGVAVPGYIEEEGANIKSNTESFVAVRVDIDNWRWAGVPFYLRTGKRMPAKQSEIMIQFKQLPHNIFKDSYPDLPPNKLSIRLQPDEGVDIEMMNKIPGIDEHIKIGSTKLDLSFSEVFNGNRVADAYERLLLEAMRGNSTLFISREEIEQAWTWIDSMQNAWAETQDVPKPYAAGSWGPDAATELMARDGRTWDI
ncbi:MAG: glucose-6-phosphate dehydrogenase [Methylococcaceae bacterium]|nr:glucose-6-phosphate dehydrogenase [Methylococcaceae bacterium]